MGPFRDKSWRKDSIWFSHKKSLVHCIVHEKNQSIDLMEKQQCFFSEKDREVSDIYQPGSGILQMG